MMPVCKPAVALVRIATYPNDFSPRLEEFIVRITECTRFLRAHRCAVLGIEEQDQRLLSEKIVETDPLAVLRGRGEVWSAIADLNLGHVLVH